jgi:hypothetical protein
MYVKIKQPKKQIVKLKARDIVLEGIDELFYFIENSNFNLTPYMLISFLNLSIGNSNLVFKPTNYRGPISSELPGAKKFIDECMYYHGGRIEIHLFSTRICSYISLLGRSRNRLYSFYDIDYSNVFLREIVLSLVHELVHVQQFKRYKKSISTSHLPFNDI